jgi:hypothetical protein
MKKMMGEGMIELVGCEWAVGRMLEKKLKRILGGGMNEPD